jgi:hypothetical protein
MLFSKIMSGDKYLKVELFGGLCNKLYCFFSAVEIALSGRYILVEPYFGWKEKVIMSDVWNIDKLCAGIPELKWCSIADFNNRVIMPENIVYKSGTELWQFSESKLSVIRNTGVLNRNSDICCRVVVLLEPAPYVLDKYCWNDSAHDLTNRVAVHFRTESDWRAYSVRKQRRMPTNELCWVDNNDILQMVLNEFGKDVRLFIVNGECGNEIKNKCLEQGVYGFYDYKGELEYEQNAAMHWWVCSRCVGGFVGLCRSTFSNLVCLRRVLDGVVGNCWIYNYCENSEYRENNNKRLRVRVDAGLQPEATRALTMKTVIN